MPIVRNPIENKETISNCEKLQKMIDESKIDLQIIVLGVMHSNEKEYNCYENIIKSIRPKFVLVEDLDFNNLQSLANECHFELVLCDLSDQEKEIMQEEILINNNLKDEYEKSNYFSDIDTVFQNCDVTHPELNLKRLFYDKREKRMGEEALKYMGSDKPIIVIIGHEHAGECSNIHNLLKGKTNYISIWKSKKYCRNCGQKIDKESKKEKCSNCGYDIYGFIISDKSCKLGS